MARMRRSVLSVTLICYAFLGKDDLIDIIHVAADDAAPSPPKPFGSAGNFIQDQVKKLQQQLEMKDVAESFKSFSALHEQLKTDLLKTVGEHQLKALPALQKLFASTAPPVVSPALEDQINMNFGSNEVSVGAKAFEITIVRDVQNFVDSLMSLGQILDLEVAFSGSWVKGFQRMIDQLLGIANDIEDEEDDPIGAQLNLILFSNAAQLLAEKMPYTKFLSFFDEKWIQNSFSRFSVFVKELGELINAGKFSSATQYFGKSRSILDGLKVFREYIQRNAAGNLPGALIKSVRDYDQFLKYLTTRQRTHTLLPLPSFPTTRNKTSNKPGDALDELKTDVSNILAPPAIELASALMLLQKKSGLSNVFKAFENYVFDYMFSSIKEDTPKSETTSNSIMPLLFSSSLWDEVSNRPSFGIDILAKEIEQINELKKFLIEFSNICSDFVGEEWNKALCGSISKTIGTEFEDVDDVPRRLQLYFDAEQLHSYQGPIEHVPTVLLPRIGATLARVPELFPVISAATSSTVNALVDSSQIVSGSMLSTAANVRDRMRDGNIFIRRQYPAPVAP